MNEPYLPSRSKGLSPRPGGVKLAGWTATGRVLREAFWALGRRRWLGSKVSDPAADVQVAGVVRGVGDDVQAGTFDAHRGVGPVAGVEDGRLVVSRDLGDEGMRPCPAPALPTWPLRGHRQYSRGFGRLGPAAAEVIPDAICGRSVQLFRNGLWCLSSLSASFCTKSGETDDLAPARLGFGGLGRDILKTEGKRFVSS
jgi:hypothetical protein